MRRALLALASTVAGLVALLSFKTHETSLATNPAAVSTAGTDPSTGTDPTIGTDATSGGVTSSGTSSSASSPAASSSPSASSSSSSSATRTVTGDSVDTRWGPVQVQITVSGGKLSAVTAVVYPTENPRDQQINAYAIPTLTQEALAAGSAKIDMVSGATYTSEGYIGSLQSALDKAGL